MDAPPPNYNPNESLFNGGTDAPIMKVMGGGGVGGGVVGGNSAPNGYNETQSLLNGGLDAVIEKIEGGALNDALGNVEFVNYKDVQSEAKDRKEFDALKTVITNYTNISEVISRLNGNILKKYKAVFRYIDRDGILERTSLGGNNNDKQIIRYIPYDSKYTLVVPPISDPYDFFIFVKFLNISYKIYL